MNTVEYSIEVANELKKTLSQVDADAAEKFLDLILRSNKIFVAGAGRSGLMQKAFANRLMHMGFEVYVVGETITPAIEKGDILIIGSGSGETGSLVHMANKAKSLGANLALVTIFPESAIGKLADIVIKIPAPTPKVEKDNSSKSIQPLGNLFEQSLLIFLDCTVIGLMNRKGKDAATMFTRHANLE